MNLFFYLQTFILNYSFNIILSDHIFCTLFYENTTLCKTETCKNGKKIPERSRSVLGRFYCNTGGRETGEVNRPFSFPMARQTLVGHDILIVEASRSYSDTPRSLRLLLASDQRQWVLKTLIYEGVNLERWGRFIGTSPQYTHTTTVTPNS